MSNAVEAKELARQRSQKTMPTSMASDSMALRHLRLTNVFMVVGLAVLKRSTRVGSWEFSEITRFLAL